VAGKYKLERVIGTGGMGVVMAAEHVELRQPVALKFLHPEMAKRPELVRRFLREGQAAARMRSEHVARVIDVGRTDDGVPFLVMELLEGIDLGQKIRREGAVRIADAALYVLQTCAAIGEAHALGIVHRDLKPANLFLTRRPDGTPLVKVVDFGISKVATDDVTPGEVTLTTGDDVLGSPLYMAPEQIRTPHGVDGRADLWSLGAILHRLVSNESAFGAPTPAAILAAIVADSPTPLRKHAPHAPEELERIVAKCLTRDLAARWQTAAELADALRPFVPRGAHEVQVTGSAASLAQVEVSSPGAAETSAPSPSPLSASPSEPITIAGGSVSSVTALPPGKNLRTASMLAVGAAVVVGSLAVLGILVFGGSSPDRAAGGGSVSSALSASPSVRRGEDDDAMKTESPPASSTVEPATSVPAPSASASALASSPGTSPVTSPASSAPRRASPPAGRTPIRRGGPDPLDDRL
jgi:serine/threonine protein kinase